MKFLVLLFIAVLSDTVKAAAVLDYCSANYVRCCITEFLILANPDRGFDFSEERINNTCMTAQDTFFCMDDLKGMCQNEELLEAVDASHSAMSELCSVDTPRYKAMKDQKCLQDSSETVKECSANAPELHLEGLTADCCKYMRFKNCALSAIKTNCSEEVAKFADNYVVDVAGLGYEQVCMDHFYHCNTASALTFSVWLFIVSSVLHLIFR